MVLNYFQEKISKDYARVSGHDQKKDLQTQIDRLDKYIPNNEHNEQKRIPGPLFNDTAVQKIFKEQGLIWIFY